jgi:MinD-like ATPase involved in chromosome partitioning or flagellar assembly
VPKAQVTTSAQTLLPRVIAISSGKGGVGKSSIAVNLGISLAKNGKRVCLLDADTGLANANILLGLTPQYSLEHVLYGAKAIEDVMLDGPCGMKIIPGANGISDCVSLHARQQLRLTRELARIESEFDYLLIDTAAGIAATTLDFISASHHSLVVITPEPTSLTDAFSLIKLLKRRRGKVALHAVVNMSSGTRQAKEVFHRFASAVDKYIGVKIRYLGYVQRDESMRAAVVLQNPVSMFPDNDPSCRGFITLADSLVTATAEPVNRSFSAYWHRQFRQHDPASNDEKNTGKSGVLAGRAMSAPATARSRDASYVSELRSRLLLLIEQGNAEAEVLQPLLEECVAAYIKRFGDSPLSILAMIEQLLSSPERDDQVLRDIASWVKPWGGFNSQPPTEEMLAPLAERAESAVLDDRISDLDKVSDSEQKQNAPIKLRQANSSQLQERFIDENPTPDLAPSKEIERLVSQGYDSLRFGSQEGLLELLQRDSKTTLSELLKALA